MPIYFGHKQVTKPDGSTPDSWHAYLCAHCGSEASGVVIGYARDTNNPAVNHVVWLQCPTCHYGSVENLGRGVSPGIAFGPKIEGLPPDVDAAYEEARRCLSVNANTAAEGICRKILMHLAVDKGATEGKSFASYIDYLEEKGYVTPPMRDWVKLIKDHGNEAQHRLKAPDRKRAEGTLLFTAQLLRSVYEMGHIAKQFSPEPPKSQGSAAV